MDRDKKPPDWEHCKVQIFNFVIYVCLSLFDFLLETFARIYFFTNFHLTLQISFCFTDVSMFQMWQKIYLYISIFEYSSWALRFLPVFTFTNTPVPPPTFPASLRKKKVKKKTGEEEDDVWQMPYFDFLSRRLILTQSVSYQGLCWLVCVGLWFHYSLLSHFFFFFCFFLKNQTITDVVTETETLVLEGLSEQVRLGASVISPVCFGGVAPPLHPRRIPRAQRPFSVINPSSSSFWSATKLLDKVPSFFSFFYFTSV